MSVEPVEPLPLDALRLRTSAKWRAYPADVLPLFVAESDFPLAPTITAALSRAIELGDTGYTASRTSLATDFAAFAARRLGWAVDPDRVRSTADVSLGVVELLRRLTSPGDRVVVTPPVYPPFFELVAEAGAVAESVPLVPSGAGWTLDLDGIEHSLRRGARAVLLCNPHNPTGTVFDRMTLARLAEVSRAYGAAVVSDEIHAPLTRAGIAFTPFLSASDAAAEVGYAVTSASKAFNLAGLKCALIVTAAPHTADLVRALPVEVQWRTGQFGLLASIAAFSAESDAWLDGVLATIDANGRLLDDLLAEHLPGARYTQPDAGYLAWVDLTALGWGDDPARRILREARVAFQSGPSFGAGGAGRVRVNFACHPTVLAEAITRAGTLIDRESGRPMSTVDG